MDYKTENEFQYHPVVIKMLEDLVGGGTLKRAVLKSTDELAPGAIVGEDVSGLLEVVKTAEVHADAAQDATTLQIKKTHELKVGDYLAGKQITAIDTSNADYDSLTIEALAAAVTAGDVLNQTDNGGEFVVEPVGVTMSSVDLTMANQQVGVLIRGTVNEKTLAYKVNAAIKAKLPLVRFDNR